MRKRYPGRGVSGSTATMPNPPDDSTWTGPTYYTRKGGYEFIPGQQEAWRGEGHPTIVAQRFEPFYDRASGQTLYMRERDIDYAFAFGPPLELTEKSIVDGRQRMIDINEFAGRINPTGATSDPAPILPPGTGSGVQGHGPGTLAPPGTTTGGSFYGEPQRGVGGYESGSLTTALPATQPSGGSSSSSHGGTSKWSPSGVLSSEDFFSSIPEYQWPDSYRASRGTQPSTGGGFALPQAFRVQPSTLGNKLQAFSSRSSVPLEDTLVKYGHESERRLNELSMPDLVSLVHSNIEPHLTADEREILRRWFDKEHRHLGYAFDVLRYDKEFGAIVRDPLVMSLIALNGPDQLADLARRSVLNRRMQTLMAAIAKYIAPVSLAASLPLGSPMASFFNMFHSLTRNHGKTKQQAADLIRMAYIDRALLGAAMLERRNMRPTVPFLAPGSYNMPRLLPGGAPPSGRYPSAAGAGRSSRGSSSRGFYAKGIGYVKPYRLRPRDRRPKQRIVRRRGRKIQVLERY